MKSKFWKQTIKLLLYTFLSLVLAVLATGILAYAYYKIFDDPAIRQQVISLFYTLRYIFTYSYGYFYIAIALVIAAIFVIFFTRRTTRRMDAIQNAVTQINNENYRVLLPNDMNDSLGIIEKELNALAGKIQDGLNERAEFEQAKDDFIVNIVHDLRTPLTSIIGYLVLLSEEKIDREISAKYASIAFEKSKQLENTIEALFDIAAFVMENVQLNKQEVNLIKFLTQKQDEMYPQLSDAEMEIRLDIPEAMPAFIVDGDLMVRVIDNLIINAIRYAKDGKYIDIIAEEQDKSVLISFVTHANPIPAAELERIFDKFYRLEKSRATNTGGSGLGLSISRRIVELHGGTLTARQTSDGTAFDICLPM